MPLSTNQPPGCLPAILKLFQGKPKATAAPVEPPVVETTAEPLPYRLRDDFLSVTELSFYHRLAYAIQNQAVIFTKIRLADILFVARPDRSYTYFNRIAARHVDFLLCQPKTLRPLVGIELDDSSHQRPERQARDEFVDRAFAAAGLPLVRMPARQTYMSSDILEQLKPYLDFNEDAEEVAQPAEQPTPPAPPPAPSEPATPPLCPKCGIPMVVRTVAKGPHQGKQFYGCKNYPQCREMKPLN